MSIHSSPLERAGGKDTGGMSTYLRGLSTALGEAGHKVDLFTRTGNPGEEGVREIGPGVRLVTLDDGAGPLAKEDIYPHCAAIAESIGCFCRRERVSYRLIFSHYWLSGCVGHILRQYWDVSHLVMFHTLGQAKNESCAGENEPRLRIEVEKELALSCDRLVASTEQDRKKMLTYFALPPEKIVLIPCGIDRTLFKPLDTFHRRKAKEQIGAAGEKIILAVGRIEPVKGFDLLLEAAGRMPAEVDFKVFIVGGDDRSSVPVARLKETAAELGLAGRVRFAGAVDYEHLPLYYNAADVTVLASHYESFGLVALESIACGTPVVAAPVGVLPALVSPAGDDTFGCLVSDRDPKSWALKILELLLRAGPIAPADIDTRLAPYNWTQAAEQFARHFVKP